MISFQSPRLTVSMTNYEYLQLQKAWTKSGKFANRSQFVKAAINAYAGEIIFESKGVHE